MITLYIILAYIIGVMGGLLLSKVLGRQHKYVGNIVVNEIGYEDDKKIVYSLELNDDPEQIRFEKEVTFKVLIPDIESDRE